MNFASRVLYAKLASQLSRRAGLRLFRLFSRPLERKHTEQLANSGLRVLSLPDVLDLCRDPQLDLRHDAVAAAYARGDFCAAAFDGHALGGYCWFAFAPLPHLDGVWVRFAGSVAWVYKSLVRPSHRGRGIAPALYRFADEACLDRGRSHSIICVESHNRPSVGAALRAGYRPCGYGGYVVGGKRLLAWSSPAAKERAVAFLLGGTGNSGPGGGEGRAGGFF